MYAQARSWRKTPVLQRIGLLLELKTVYSYAWRHFTVLSGELVVGTHSERSRNEDPPWKSMM